MSLLAFGVYMAIMTTRTVPERSLTLNAAEPSTDPRSDAATLTTFIRSPVEQAEPRHDATATQLVLLGTVYGPGDQPMQDAVIDVTSLEEPGHWGRLNPPSMRTDPGGRFAIKVFPGEYVVEATARGLHGWYYRARGGQDIVVRLVPSAKLRVRVEDELGGPVNAATVNVIQQGRYVAKGSTDAFGLTAELTVPLGALSVMAFGRDIVPVTEDCQVDAQYASCVVRVRRGTCLLRGRVVLEGAAVDGATVQDTLWKHKLDVSDTSGSFSLGLYPKGRQAVVCVSHPELRTAIKLVLVAEETSYVIVSLSRGRTLRVRVRNKEGTAVPNAVVSSRSILGISDGGSVYSVQDTASSTTGADGVAVLAGLPAGKVAVDVDHPDYCKEYVADIAAVQDEIDVVLQAAKSISVNIQLVEEVRRILPYGSWTLVLRRKGLAPNASPSASTWSTRFDTKGNGFLNRIPEGAYELDARAQVGGTQVRSLDKVHLTDDQDEISYLCPEIVLEYTLSNVDGPAELRVQSHDESHYSSATRVGGRSTLRCIVRGGVEYEWQFLEGEVRHQGIISVPSGVSVHTIPR